VRETFHAYRVLMALSFRAAPLHATFQLLTGVLMALAFPAAAYGAKLLVDAAVAGDAGQGGLATAVLALATAGSLVVVFYYVDCVFGVFERAGGLASVRLMRLMGGTDGMAHHERPDYLDQAHLIRERRADLAASVNATAGVLRALVTLLATAVLLARVHPVLLLLPAFAGLSVWLGKRAKDIDVTAEEATAEAERLRRHLFDVGTAAPAGKELRVFGLGRALLDRHHEVSGAVLRTRNRATWQGAALQSLDGVVTGLGYGGAVAVVLVMAVSGTATPGDVILVIGLASQLSMAVFAGVLYLAAFLRVLTLAKRFVWLERYAARARRVPAVPVPVPARLHDGIAVRDVSFSYPGAGRPVLDGVSLHLPAGSVVALVGENGAGKTTLIKLLCDFYQPDRGRILIDGVDLASLPPEAWRSRLSAAFQDFAPLEFLARETVGVADLPRVHDPVAVGAALERAGASSVVDGLPRGLDTQLGTRWDGGVELSGGQWQKLALARGLMRADPLLVVFDEPTAALDPQTEHALFERFAAATRAGSRHGTVTLLVSHRFSTVRMADLIVVLDGGRVRESGSHAELMATGGLYAELYQLQSRSYQ
jgi:ABC-type multidrug transport system fused ATPase/permease subunit